MIDPVKVEGMFRNLGRYLGYLRQLAQTPRAEFLADFTKTGSARYYLHVAIECCLDIANHIIAGKSLRPPKDYADCFVVLGESGVVPTDFIPTLRQMARMRNRLTHLYWDVDDEVVYQVLTSELDDFDRFKAYVLSAIGADSGTDTP